MPANPSAYAVGVARNLASDSRKSRIIHQPSTHLLSDPRAAQHATTDDGDRRGDWFAAQFLPILRNTLTSRQRNVLHGYQTGESTAELARRLGTSRKSIREIRRAIRKKWIALLEKCPPPNRRTV